MKPRHDPRDREPKKSEILIVRLSHEAKQAFMNVCRREDRSASDVVRDLVDGYVARRSASRLSFNTKEFAMLISQLSTPARIAAAAAAGALGAVALTVAPSTADGDARAAFDRMDANGDGLVDRAEFFATAGFDAKGAPTRETVDAMVSQAVVESRLSAGTDEESSTGEISQFVMESLTSASLKISVLFEQIDEDGNDAWSFAEFELMAKRTGGIGFRSKRELSPEEKAKLETAYKKRAVESQD